jgi:hypothetical protein
MVKLDLSPTEALAVFEAITACVQAGLARNPEATLDALAVRARLKASKDVSGFLKAREEKGPEAPK